MSSTAAWQRQQLERDLGPRYRHESADIRDTDAIRLLFRSLADEIALVVHTAAQPSHDWAAREPHTDFTVNANGTLRVLEAARQCGQARPVTDRRVRPDA